MRTKEQIANQMVELMDEYAVSYIAERLQPVRPTAKPSRNFTVKAKILDVLKEGPKTRREIIAVTDGRAIQQTLSNLLAQRLIRSEGPWGQRVYSLVPEGERAAE